jgi:hypothetical protein
MVDARPIEGSETVRLARPAIELTFVVLLTGFMTFESVRASFQYGRLSAPSMFDDVGYFVDGQQWLNELQLSGIVQSTIALLSHHSPLSSLFAAIAFAIFGPNDWGPYLINGVLLGLTFVAVLRFLAHEGAPLVAALIMTLCLAFVPFFQTTVTEFRPDLFHGVLVAVAILFLFRSPIFLAPRSRQIRLGLLFGLALLAKPAVFLAAGFVISVAVVVSTLGFLNDLKLTLRHEIRSIATAYAYLLLGTAAVFGPYLAVSGGSVVEYVYLTLISNIDVWAYRGDLIQQILFYSIGDGGGTALDFWFWVALATFLARMTLAIRSRDRVATTIGGYVSLAAIYLAISSTPLKHYFLGSMFYATFSLMMARDWVWLFLQVRKHVPLYGTSSAYGTLIVLFGLAYVVIPHPLVAAYPAEMVDATRAATLDAWSVVLEGERRLKESGRTKPLTVLANGNDPVNLRAIELEARRGQLNVQFQSADVTASADEFVAMAKAADFIIVTQSPQSFLPGERLGESFAAALQAAGFKALYSIDGRGRAPSLVFVPPP